mmetsp:Transcript_21107/g.49986  ORF Transcript_21107/g.49986 Transcript_21107/m.49986 type:complete len:279 (-) Transcript_21107:320-1156(-)
MALSPFIGLELRTVFKLHSAFAGLCGALATLAPSFFGQVFPDLAAPDTLAFIVRVYAVLLTAQAPLLYGIRQIESASGLRPFCAVYAIVFGGTAAVCAHSELVLGVVRDECRGFYWLWLGLATVYLAFALFPRPALFRPWSLMHMGCVARIGTEAIYAPEAGTMRYFLVPSLDAYNTVSRYYGLLILGMSLLAAASSRDAARPAWRSIRFGFSAMFAASGAYLAEYLSARGGGIDAAMHDAIGSGSLLTFFAMAAAYGTATLPAAPPAALPEPPPKRS